MGNDPRSGKRVVRGNQMSNPRAKKEFTLDEAFEAFYNAKKAEGMRPRTLKDYLTHWRYFREWLDPQYPEIKLREITTTLLRQYLEYMSSERTKYEGIEDREQEGTRLSPYTVAIRLRSLRTMFNFFSAESFVPLNPIANIKQPRFDREETHTFTDDDLRKLLDAPDTNTFPGLRDRTLYALLADSGLRIEEALRLQIEHIDFKSRAIHLPGHMNKNRKPRIVPLSPEVIRELLTLINKNREYFDTDFIFIANYGDPLKADHARKRLTQHAIKAGVDPALAHPHQFRAYFCTSYLLNGGDIFSLQRIVSHASIETTKRYMKINDDNIRQQHARFSPIAKLGMTRVGKR